LNENFKNFISIMKTYKNLVVVLLLISLLSCNNQGPAAKDLKTELDSVSYAIGIDIGSKLKAGVSEVDYDLVIQGIRNLKDSSNFLIETDKVQEIMQSYFEKKQLADMEKRREEAEKKAEVTYGDVKRAGEEFLAENLANASVQTTSSGLQYEVLVGGNGEMPTEYSKVKILYKGTLLDGTVFDSREDRDQPLEMMANQFVKGFTEGLLLMTKGSKYKFYIPQELGYGAFPRGGIIKPFSVLIFEVELLDFEDPNASN